MKSPLKDKPLRNPGQSIDERINDFISEDLIQYIFIAGSAILLAVMEWYRWAMKTQPSPVIYTVMAFVAVLFTARKIFVARKKIKALKLGRDAEKAVGQYLELLREHGAKVFHDIQGKGFNLDHVVIDKSGIYVIETKAISKPDRGNPIVAYDGEKILVNGREPDRNPVVQVRAACHWLKTLLKESTGKDCNPRPVVVFPGWFVEPTAEAKNSDVWVLNPKALPSFISNSKPQLKEDEMNILSYHLSRYVRAEGGK